MIVTNRDPEDLLAWLATEVTSQVDRELAESGDRWADDEDTSPGDDEVVLDEDVAAEIDAAARLVVARRLLSPQRDDATTTAGPAEHGVADHGRLVRGSFWQRLKDPERDALVAVGTTARYSAGQALFRAGDPPTCVHILLDGWVRIVASPPDRPDLDVMLTVRGPGDVLGEGGALCGTGRNATVEALEDARTLVVGADVLGTVLEVAPRLVRILERITSDRLTESELLRQSLYTATRGQRLATVVVKLISYAAAGSFTDPDAPVSVFLPLSVADLASMAVMPVSRAQQILQEWTDNGLLRFNDGELTVLHPGTLRAQARGSVHTTSQTQWELGGRATGDRWNRGHQAMQAWEGFHRLQTSLLEQLERMPEDASA